MNKKRGPWYGGCIYRIVVGMCLVAGCQNEAVQSTPGIKNGLAIISSDYKTTSVSLLDPQSMKIVRERCIDSGSSGASLSLALSGNVVFPSQPQVGNELTLIDRTNSAITWIDPVSCLPRRQLSVSTGYSSIPEDLISVTPTKAYVLRYQKNPSPTAEPSDWDEGDDLLVINPSVPSIIKRIDLSPHASMVEGKAIEARPIGGWLVGTKLYVMIHSLNSVYDAQGTARLVVVDTGNDTVSEVVEFPGMKNCAAPMEAWTSSTLLMACSGSVVGGVEQVNSSGIVLLDIGVSPAVIQKKLPASALDGRPISSWLLNSAKGSIAFAASVGDYKGERQNDALFVIDWEKGESQKLLESGAFSLGRSAVDEKTDRLFVPIGNRTDPRIEVWDAASFQAAVDAMARPANRITTGDGLPPRLIAWY